MESWPSYRETSAMGPPWPMLHWLLEGTGCRIRARCVSAWRVRRSRTMIAVFTRVPGEPGRAAHDLPLLARRVVCW